MHATTLLTPSSTAGLRTSSVRRLFGLDFTDCDVAACAAWIDARPDQAPFGYVVTPNADHFVRLYRQPDLRPLYTGAMLCLLDSRVVARAAGLLGLDPPSVAPGSDLTAELLAHHLRPRERITIIGVKEPHLPELIRRTGIAPPAHYNPPMGFDQDPAEMARAVRFVLDNPARYVFLAVGSPRQEKLAAAIAATGAAKGTGLCIGASLEFLAGAIPRAPGFMQKAGIEWLYRLIGAPRRLSRRYLVDNPMIFRLLWQERLNRGRQTDLFQDFR